MKILFVNAINPHVEVESRYPNLGLGYLASALRSKLKVGSIDIKIVDRVGRKELVGFNSVYLRGFDLRLKKGKR